ncbi:MAG: hypothetical protein K2H73_06990, partial [Treponemataceae bacterium]|nr:hypothetical protein [Treponemataceae bacterium]
YSEAGVLSLQATLFPQHRLGLPPQDPASQLTAAQARRGGHGMPFPPNAAGESLFDVGETLLNAERMLLNVERMLLNVEQLLLNVEQILLSVGN